ncbi:MAG: acyl-CoA dehydrogenase [Gammaproteobacteria bacterium]|nr:acyl-CoA dehydrogenase [Gammaproteobacteria bacterium]
MNFDFDEEQIALRGQARRMLEERGALTAARGVLEQNGEFDEALWREMTALGWPAVNIAEKYGGLGLGSLYLCVIAEELGRSLAPTPFGSSIYLAAEALTLAGTEEQKTRWLPRLAAGEAIATIAIAEGRGASDPKRLQTSIKAGRLVGAKTAVPDALDAAFAVVLAADPAAHAPSLVLVDLAGDGVARTKVPTIDPSRGHAEIRFDGVPCEPLGVPGTGWELWTLLRDRAAVPFAFEAIGGAQACLEASVACAQERYAFGRPIGSFQAIKHKLADLFVAIELARSNAYFAAWALSTEAPQLAAAAAAARLSTTEAYWQAARENLHVHGGIGCTQSSNCHLFYRRSKLLAVNLGGPRFWRDRLGDEIASGRAELGA